LFEKETSLRHLGEKGGDMYVIGMIGVFARVNKMVAAVSWIGGELVMRDE
jgi:hypothetical protein